MLKFVSFFSISTLAEENVIEKQDSCNRPNTKGEKCEFDGISGFCYYRTCRATCKPESTALMGAAEVCLCGSATKRNASLCKSGEVCDINSMRCSKAATSSFGGKEQRSGPSTSGGFRPNNIRGRSGPSTSGGSRPMSLEEFTKAECKEHYDKKLPGVDVCSMSGCKDMDFCKEKKTSETPTTDPISQERLKGYGCFDNCIKNHWTDFEQCYRKCPRVVLR